MTDLCNTDKLKLVPHTLLINRIVFPSLNLCIFRKGLKRYISTNGEGKGL